MVDESLLIELFEAVRSTGSARNRQPWRWTVCCRAEDRRAVADSGRYAAFLAAAPVVAVLSIDRQRGGNDTDFDAGRAMERLITTAHFAGLGACPATLDADRADALAPTPQLGPSAVPSGRLGLDDIVDWRLP